MRCEWIKGLGSGFTNPVGKGGVLDVCLCLNCGGVGSVGGVWCAILLHLIDICFLSCICLWQISQIQTCLCVVVGPGFVSTSPAIKRVYMTDIPQKR